jgi:hypothetical protein
MRVPRAVSGVLTLVSTILCTRAFALSQPDHLSLTERVCADTGLPARFCQSVAFASYDVDAESWDDPSAHGQIPAGGRPCAAADKTLERVERLAASQRDHVLLALTLTADDRDAALTDAARDLGRALHTIQDTCVHSGMTNPQHAFFSDSDLCRGTHLSPDIQPAGRACAEELTAAALSDFMAAVDAAGLPRVELGRANLNDWTRYPELGKVCDFMHSAPSWNGHDTRWNNDRVLPVLGIGFRASLRGDAGVPRTVCPTSDGDLARVPDPALPGGRLPSCAEMDAFCLAGDLTSTSEMPPFYNADGVAPVLGCAVAGPSADPPPLALAIGIAILVSLGFTRAAAGRESGCRRPGSTRRRRTRRDR